MEMKQVKNITVIGAGRMGCGIAPSWAQAACNVTMVDLGDRILRQSFSVIKSNLIFLIENL